METPQKLLTNGHSPDKANHPCAGIARFFNAVIPQGNLQKPSDAGDFGFDDIFRRSLGDDFAALGSGFGTEVESDGDRR